MDKHKRHITKWECVRVTRRRLIAPYTYDFVWNMQVAAWWLTEIVPFIPRA